MSKKATPLEDLWQTFQAQVLMATDKDGLDVARKIFFAGAEAAVSLVDIGDVPTSVVRELENFEEASDAEAEHGKH